MKRIRSSVRENRLTSTVLTDADYIDAIERNGRGWVLEIDSQVVAFAVGDARTGNVWALFVEPDHEGRGYGKRLHDAMVEWLWSQGLRRLWLTTEPGSRAQRFYEATGWTYAGKTERGEALYEMFRAD